MKKILVSVMMLISLSTAGFALNPSNDYDALRKLNKKEVFTNLMGYVSADQEQIEFLQNVVKVTESELNKAESTQNERLAKNVVNYNLNNAKCILSDEQYRKYLAFVNYYLKNDNLLSLNNK